MVLTPMSLAIWMTARPTMLLAPFWMITSPGFRVSNSRSRQYAVAGLMVSVDAYAAGMSLGTFTRAF